MPGVGVGTRLTNSWIGTVPSRGVLQQGGGPPVPNASGISKTAAPLMDLRILAIDSPRRAGGAMGSTEPVRSAMQNFYRNSVIRQHLFRASEFKASKRSGLPESDR